MKEINNGVHIEKSEITSQYKGNSGSWWEPAEPEMIYIWVEEILIEETTKILKQNDDIKISLFDIDYGDIEEEIDIIEIEETDCYEYDGEILRTYKIKCGFEIEVIGNTPSQSYAGRE